MIFYTHDCEEKIGYSFKDKLLLRTCFTHTSYSNEHGEESNENLEFLGDSILNFTVAEYLFKAHSGDEGDMTKRRAELVSTEPIGEAVRRMGLDEFLLVGEGEKNRKPKLNMCADLFEAVVAGIYLDGGEERAKKFIYDNLLSVKTPLKNICDNKTKLQEFVQSVKGGAIEYVLLKKEGPDHSPKFTSAVFVGGNNIASGEGTSKKNAEQSAAGKALEILSKKSFPQKKKGNAPAKKERGEESKFSSKNGNSSGDKRKTSEKRERQSEKGEVSEKIEKTSGKNGDKKAFYRTNKKKRAIKAQIITVKTPKRGKLN